MCWPKSSHRYRHRFRRTDVLTRSGWLTLGSGLLLVIAGRIFGLVELYILGAAAIGLTLLAIGWILLRPRNIMLSRSVSTARLHAGDSSQVQVEISNPGSFPSPVLRVTDDVAGTRGAELELPPIGPGRTRAVGYRLPTERRGRVSVGPLRTHFIDPFSLVSSQRQVAGNEEVLVYPRVDAIAPPPRPPGDDARLADRQASQLGRSSDQFYALREYVVGDDLRRVHWPSTARFDDAMMVRQDELPQQGRTTVLLDTQSESATAETFERMVSATASLIMAARRRDDLVRLVATDGTDTGFTPNSSHDPALDYLATVSRGAGNAEHAAMLASRGNPGSMVMVLGVGADLGRVAAGRRRTASSTIIFTNSADPGAIPKGSTTGLASDLMVMVGPDVTFRDAWTNALAMLGRR